jgi:glutaredoxin 2
MIQVTPSEAGNIHQMKGEEIMDQCERHGDLMKSIGALEKASETHGDMLSEIFDIVRNIKESVDKNGVAAQQRDKALEETKSSIQKVDSKIENGLKMKVDKLSDQYDEFLKCYTKHAEARKKGFRGVMNRAWTQFLDKLGFLFLVVVALLILCALQKIPISSVMKYLLGG